MNLLIHLFFGGGNLNERQKRSQYHGNNKKHDRILNLLIAIVSILIVIKLVHFFTENDEVKEKENENQFVEHDEQNSEQKNSLQHHDEDGEKATDELIHNENEHEQAKENITVTKVEHDEFVEEIIINNNWEAVPTKQTGTHVSTFEEGHIDYEEKLEAIRQAVQLDKNDIIYWSVRNNGTPNSAISIISSKNQKENYRVSIEWVHNEGWKPVKVEKLKKLEGLVKNH